MIKNEGTSKQTDRRQISRVSLGRDHMMHVLAWKSMNGWARSGRLFRASTGT